MAKTIALVTQRHLHWAIVIIVLATAYFAVLG